MKKYDVRLSTGKNRYVFVPDEINEELSLEDFAIAIASATRKALVDAVSVVLEGKDEPTEEDVVMC